MLEIIQHGEIRTPIVSAKPPKLAVEAAQSVETPAAPESTSTGGTVAPIPA